MVDAIAELKKVEWQQENSIPATEQQVELAREYLKHLDARRVKKTKPLREDFLRDSALGWCALVYKFGNGNIIKAVERHTAMIWNIKHIKYESQNRDMKDILNSEPVKH